MLKPGKRIPVNGTNIDGKYDAVMFKVYIINKYKMKIINTIIICYFKVSLV